MILALALLAFQAAAAPATQEPNPCDSIERNAWDPKFKPGQKWAYHSRPIDVGSTVTISEVDNLPGTGLVVYVVVDRVNAQPVFPLPITEQFVINRDSLDASVTEVVNNIPVPDPRGYSNWRAHCLAETHTTTVADTLTSLGFQRCEQELKARRIQLPLPCKVTPNSKTPSPAPATSSPASSSTPRARSTTSINPPPSP